MRGLALLLALLPGTALALDCNTASTQSDMILCAAEQHAKADYALNDAYKAALAKAKSVDGWLAQSGQSATQTLREAQRAWITYRDLACMAEALPYDGGSIQGLIHTNCLARLTIQRTEDLRDFSREG